MSGNQPAIKRILYLDHAPIFGGAEVMLLNLIAGLDRKRWLPIVATSANAPFQGALDKAGIESFSVPFGRLNRSGLMAPFHMVQAVRSVIHLIHDRDIDLIHTNTVRAHIIGSLAALLTHTPLVWTLHDNTFPLRPVKMLAVAPRCVICVALWLRDLYVPQGLGSKVAVIHNGLDLAIPLDTEAGLRDELGVPPGAPFMVYVGRLVAGKAPHLFVQAAQQVLRSQPDAYFAIVGGPDRQEAGQPASTYPEQLAQVVKVCNLGRQLIMAGQRDDVGRFYAAADALAYTSIQPEGLPTVLLEAMRYSLPVVASDIGGAAEIVEDGVTGWCVPPNDVDALANAMLRLLSNREQARILGVNGRVRLQNEFDLRRQVAQTQAICEQALSKDR